MWEWIMHVNHCQIIWREERVRLMRLKSTLSALNEICRVIWCKKRKNQLLLCASLLCFH